MEKISKILKAMYKTEGAKPVIQNRTSFQVLIATVLSQRTRDKNTALASKQLFEKYSNAKTLSKAPLKEVRKLVKPAGFYKVKASRIKEIATLLVKKFDGVVPEGSEALMSLPGVGRKTANCVLVYAFKKPAMPVDTHVHRISNRLGLAETKNPEQTEFALMKLVPKKNWLELNHLMVRYGQTTCLPRNPRCHACELTPDCGYFLNTVGKKQV